MGYAQRHAEQGEGYDAHEQSATHLEGQQTAGENQAGEQQKRLGRGDIAQDQQLACSGGDEAGIFQGDGGDEQAQPHGYGVFQAGGNAVDDGLPDVEKGHEDEEQAFDKDGGQCELPGMPHVEHYRVGDKKVDSYSRRQREGKIGA